MLHDLARFCLRFIVFRNFICQFKCRVNGNSPLGQAEQVVKQVQNKFQVYFTVLIKSVIWKRKQNQMYTRTTTQTCDSFVNNHYMLWSYFHFRVIGVSTVSFTL